MKYHCLHRRFTYRMMGRRLARGGHPPSRQRILFWFLAISASSDKLRSFTEVAWALVSRHRSGGEFGWGGISVIQ